MIEMIREALRALSEAEYKAFNCKLIPGVPVDRVLGVRTPAVRALAKRVSKGEFGDARACLAEYARCGADPAGVGGTELFYEEVLLQGMIIGHAKLELAERLAAIRDFVPRIDNWAVCDVVCGDLKFADKRENRAEVWEFLQEYLADGRPDQAGQGREYYIRFGVVMLLGHFIDDEYVDRVLEALYSIRHGAYYVSMAVAWAISICYIKFPQKTLPHSVDNRLDDFTHNKSIQKIRESYRVSQEDKERLNLLKRGKAGKLQGKMKEYEE